MPSSASVTPPAPRLERRVAASGTKKEGAGQQTEACSQFRQRGGVASSAVIVFGWPSTIAVFTLVVVAASTVSYGVLSGSRRSTMAGIEGFVLIAAAVLLSDGDVGIVSAAVVGSIAILIATETERLIAASRDEHPPRWIRNVEWLALLGVPVVTIGSALGDLGYLPLLATFGAAALIFGILTQVRRRVFSGSITIAAAIVLAVATPLAEAVAVGMATAGAVGVTFSIGVFVILIAILMERYQHSVGTRLSRLTDAMEGWE